MKNEAKALKHVSHALQRATAGDQLSAKEFAIKAWRLCPKSKNVLTAAMGMLVDLGEDEITLELLQEAAADHGSSDEIFNIIGEMAQRMHLYDMAEKAFHHACRLNGGNSSSLLSLALSMKLNNKSDEAIDFLQSSLQIFPENDRMWGALGILLIEHRNDHENGLLFLRQAVELAPNSVTALHNLALKLYFGEEAESLLTKALRLEPDNAHLHVSYALFLLSHGRTEEGWKHYEYRLNPELGANKVPCFTHCIPEWKGESLAGKSILICPEQGIGDEVFFAAFVPEMINLAEQVYIGCEPRLVGIYQRSFPSTRVFPFADQRQFRYRERSFPELEEEIANKETIVDYSIPVGSLPKYLAPTVDKFKDTPGGFLIPCDDQIVHFETMIKTAKRPKIAISWRSGKLTHERKFQFFATEVFRRLANAIYADFYVLQYEYTEEERQSLSELDNVHFFDDVDLKQNIEANIAILSLMDFSIGPPTATQMFAVGVGCPIIMLSVNPPWTFFNDYALGQMYASGSCFVHYTDVDVAEAALLELFKPFPPNRQYTKLEEQAHRYNSKPVAWFETIAGQEFKEKRNAVWKRTTEIELLSRLSQSEQSVCNSIDRMVISLGPYRNLNRTMALLFGLHSEAIVLNNAVERLQLFEDIDVFNGQFDKKWQQFKEVAVRLSQGGQPGDYGGSIFRSGFMSPHSKALNLYLSRFKSTKLKVNPKILFWSDSMRLTNRSKVLDHVSKDYLSSKQNPIFILPVGNPIRCALQTVDTGFGFFLTGKHSNSFESILTCVMDLYDVLFQKLEKKELNFFPLWEDNLSVETLKALCEFVSIEFSQEWAEQIIDVHQEENLSATDQNINYYHGLINDRFAGLTEIKAQFEAFLAR